MQLLLKRKCPQKLAGGKKHDERSSCVMVIHRPDRHFLKGYKQQSILCHCLAVSEIRFTNSFQSIFPICRYSGSTQLNDQGKRLSSVCAVYLRISCTQAIIDVNKPTKPTPSATVITSSRSLLLKLASSRINNMA